MNGIPVQQFGIRKGRSTTDCVSTLFADIHQGFIRGKHTFVLAIDLKGAFSNILPKAIYDRLVELRTPDKILNFVSFLIQSKNLFFSSDTGNPKSSYIGVPQGGVLSPLLFNIAISKILQIIPHNIKCLMFADDLLLYIRSQNAADAIKALKDTLTNLKPWLGEVGLSISPGKSQLSVFSRSKQKFDILSLEHDGVRIPMQEELLYLGIFLDRRLTWAKHINEVARRATLAINIMKAMSKITWGASPESMLLVYKGLVRAHLKWGCQLFSLASNTHLKKLNRVQNAAMRTILGSMRSTPINIMLSEIDEPPLVFRRMMLNRKHMIKNLSWTQNPLTPKLQLLHETNISLKHKRKNTFYTKLSLLESYCDSIQFLNKNMRTKKLSYFNLTWAELLTPTEIEIDIETGSDIKNSQQPNSKFNTLVQSKFIEYVLIYTDGSIDSNKTTSGASFVVPITNVNFGVNLGGIASIESCEMYAINSALSYAISTNLDNILILSDSRSTLKKLKELFFLKDIHPLLIKMIQQISILVSRGSNIKFLWIPSHMGITGNERADRWAKKSLSLPFGRSIAYPASEIIPLVSQDFQGWRKTLWPHYGEQQSYNKYFYNINNKTRRPWFQGIEAPRKYMVLINRLRSNHLRIGSHFERMGWTLPRGCVCGAEIQSMNHLLSFCPNLSPGRPHFFSFLSSKLTDFDPDRFDLDVLIYNPDKEIVTEIGKFFESGNIQI
ncbi:uncharacterized protein LOC122507632 [Leptopilina heterotoma]|uniref:uncharacterized protein LOC122507632 n=1 Tax=Leptopilina heterotoma TaxID=63436 RepID=UPI001CA8EE92|nr:uncharacterized protein LOC122507632 [Leptopilina heterotoma]